MAEVKAEQEPSIEEILESIRQIISEDAGGTPPPSNLVLKGAPPEPPIAAAPPPPPPPPPQVKAAPAAPPPLDLTEKVNAVPLDLRPQPSTSSVTIEMMDSPMTDEMNTLLSQQTAESATESLAKILMSNIVVEKDEVSRVGKVTLEDIARELMRPMLKTWLDQNLPGIIERIVQKEVEKLSRRAMDR